MTNRYYTCLSASKIQSRHDFLWGASTSSYQVEGGITNNDWHFFTIVEPIRKRISAITKPNFSTGIIPKLFYNLLETPPMLGILVIMRTILSWPAIWV